MSISQETKDRIHQFAGNHAVSGYIDGLVSGEPLTREVIESHDSSALRTVRLLYGGFITIGIAAGALTGFISSGGRRRFSSGGWIDTLIGTAAGLMVGMGFGLLGDALHTGFKGQQ